jgi:RNA polymerase sigma-70 factor, ECF subfamily
VTHTEAGMKADRAVRHKDRMTPVLNYTRCSGNQKNISLAGVVGAGCPGVFDQNPAFRSVMSTYSLGEELTGIVLQDRASLALQDQVARLFLDARDDVYRYLLSLGLYPPQAQEGAQEVFLRLYATLKKGEKIQNPRAWIFRVAHNLGLKIRARQNFQAPFDADLESALAGPGMNPEQSLLEREQTLLFHRAIENLSTQQRQCLFLRLEGLRYPEIASALGISASAVGEFLRRAISRLKRSEL